MTTGVQTLQKGRSLSLAWGSSMVLLARSVIRVANAQGIAEEGRAGTTAVNAIEATAVNASFQAKTAEKTDQHGD